ncbi:phosphotransferase [Methanoculleus chikugoensis]|uniref:phosphotransferase family protein n=1 Tax=Methanoculleus chikugoensis TaxID=118126 RepID=UPI0006D19F9F|nr:aminoglycoside phosphotransferase family protein [Methanoculleus chikugoensis]
MTDEREVFEKVEAQVRALTGGYTAVRSIPKGGFSFERKYLLSCGDAKRYLLRIAPPLSDPGVLPYKLAEFEVIRQLRNYSSLVPGAHAFGTSDDGSLCFMVLDFMEGTDGEAALGGLALQDQYRLGVQAGRELKRLHAMPAPKDLPDWPGAVSAKYARKAAAFDAQSLRPPGGIDRARLSRYIRENISCIHGAGRTFLHGDYHPANLIVRDGRLTGIIDFNRHDWGDPVHDFLKMAFFTRAISIPFSVGQIDGYHEGPVPALFWKGYAVYCALTIVLDLLWAHDYARKSGLPGEIGRSEARVRRVYADHQALRWTSRAGTGSTRDEGAFRRERRGGAGSVFFCNRQENSGCCRGR